MRLGIDATGIRSGGGLTHLVEVLKAARPAQHGFDGIVVWGGAATLAQIPEKPWLSKVPHAMQERNLLLRTYWQRFRLTDSVRRSKCDLLFVPGGSYAGSFRPVVTMSQNMLPFQRREARRYGLSATSLRLAMLRRSQAGTLRRASGVIFLSEYARNTIMSTIGTLRGQLITVPHGIERRFIHAPRVQKSMSEYSPASPMRLIYVSIVDLYKHQWTVCEAVCSLRKEGFPIALDLIGPAYPRALRKLTATLRSIDPDGVAVRYLGHVPHDELHALYASADFGLFASSCESMPNILIEGMASGLPIACSNRGPMPEVLGDGGVYFDPETSASIADAIRRLLVSRELRAKVAQVAFLRAGLYSWERCADETLRFLAQVASAGERVPAIEH
jgi:glycosyltransferase involved in cell wall biosynthesis